MNIATITHPNAQVGAMLQAIAAVQKGIQDGLITGLDPEDEIAGTVNLTTQRLILDLSFKVGITPAS